MKIIVYLNSLATVFAGQVEGASAVVGIDQVDAGGSWGANTRNAIVNVLFAVLTGVTFRTKKLRITKNVK